MTTPRLEPDWVTRDEPDEEIPMGEEDVLDPEEARQNIIDAGGF